MIPHLQSPLFGTAIVLAGLSAIAIPLVRLTAHPQDLITPARPNLAAAPASKTIPAVIRIRTIAALEELEITTPSGASLFHSQQLEAGEAEADVELPWHEDETSLTVTVHASERETAVFLTVMPDGYEERTAYTIGADEFEEELSFHWNHE